MKFFASILLLGLSYSLYAQPELNLFNNFTLGEYYFLLADNVNLRVAPDTKSDLITKIPIGTELKILEKSDETLLLSGIRAPWYKVAFYKEGVAKSGFLWGGFIALDRLVSATDEGTSFLIGIEKSITNMEEGQTKKFYTFQIRACRNGKELSKLNIEGCQNIVYPTTSAISDGKGVSGVKNILEFGFKPEIEGPLLLNHIIFWDAAQLHLVQSFENIQKMTSVFSNQFIYPSDEDGQNDVLIHRSTFYQLNENSGIFENRQNQDLEAYTWDGKNLIIK